jgi:hypothetical protein
LTTSRSIAALKTKWLCKARVGFREINLWGKKKKVKTKFHEGGRKPKPMNQKIQKMKKIEQGISQGQRNK